jgi:sugar/nucleoside kinase (ribokinase family)
MFDLYCLGGASIDLILEAPRLPKEGEKFIVRQIGQMAGGFIANTACGAAKLGLHTAWGGMVGDDDFGQILIDDFKNFGVEINDILIEKEFSTDYTVILLSPSGERTILIIHNLPVPVQLTQQMKQNLQNTRIGYTVFYEKNWFKEVANLLHSGNGKIAVDMEVNTLTNQDNLKAMLADTDILFSNEEGLCLVAGNSDLNENINKIFTMGPELVILNMGSNGAKAFTPTEQFTTGIFKVPVKDTTGAGDCFHAAFLYGLISNWSIQKSLTFAGAASARLIQKVGARNGLPTEAEVQNFLKENTNSIQGEI